MLSHGRHMKRYTLEEFLEYAERDDKRYELVDGYICMMASPTTAHQDICGEIFSAFKEYLRGKECRVFIAPLDVRLLEEDGSCENVFQPDVFIVCDKSKIKERGCEGAPDLVVEVISQSTQNMDYIIKSHHYMRSGVKEYWLVNPITKQTTVYQKQNGDFSAYTYSFEETVEAGLFKGLAADLKGF
jgi:Uma2 family endonuclease